MQSIDEQLLNSLTQLAHNNPRLRINHNFHASSDDKVQRLLNAMEPGNNESAGKKSGRTTQGNKQVKAVLTEIAWAAN